MTQTEMEPHWEAEEDWGDDGEACRLLADKASSAVGPLRADVDLARLLLASKITPASANTPACPDRL